jgi:GR25 family glycosyltransferase involved in LPS biosynthesis
MDLKNSFDRVVLISLKRRSDRLKRAKHALRQAEWPFKEPEVFEAVDGHAVPAPEGWQSGPGAWGCLRSHQLVLERAIADRVQSLLVLEDDICFVDDFKKNVEAFLRAVPDDWDQLMIGGHHISSIAVPQLVNPAVYRCIACDRGHCYAVRGEFMRKLYQRLAGGGKFNGDAHADWIMARDPELQLQHNVYAPVFFLAGQSQDHSDIVDRVLRKRFWNPPAADLPLVYFEGPASAALALREYGFYLGADVDADTGINVAVDEIVSEPGKPNEWRIAKLREVIEEMQWEVASNPHLIATIWHPNATALLVNQASLSNVLEIRARTADEAIAQLPKALRRPRLRPLAQKYVIYLHAPRRVMEGMRPHGWHSGVRDEEGSFYDADLAQLYREGLPRPARLERLAAVVAKLQKEAQAITDGIAVVWHPGIDVRDVRAAVSATVVDLRPKSLREALEQWEDMRLAPPPLARPIPQRIPTVVRTSQSGKRRR